ncbi:ABC transporter permease [Actinocorallia populi]|uniref:ABC transporter permease n=1 Tax=Actinocorallia populi TaxID=2079200 RepID=UPI000D08A2CA|nr:ABC transporter permease [Actinocorallia populi]
MKALAIAGTELRMMLRDRGSVFFIFLMPMMLILVVGVAFGSGGDARVGLVVQDGGPLAARMAAELRELSGLRVRVVSDVEDLTADVERGRLEAGVVIPDGYDRAVRAGSAGVVRFVSREGAMDGVRLGFRVQAVAGQETERLKAARYAASQGDGPLDEMLARADRTAPSVPEVAVETVTVGEEQIYADAEQFDVGASQQLVLFIFLTAMNGSVAMIVSRRLGIANRMLATPTPVRTILAGTALARVGLALFQGLVLMIGSAALFGVGWGSPAGAAALLVAFCLAGGGAAMLAGAIFRTEQQVNGVGLLLSLGLGALGGSMMPMEFFSPALRTVAFLIPHGWANDGFAVLVLEGGGLGDILVNVGVLLAYAAVLLALGTWLLRRALLSGVR